MGTNKHELWQLRKTVVTEIYSYQSVPVHKIIASDIDLMERLPITEYLWLMVFEKAEAGTRRPVFAYMKL